MGLFEAWRKPAVPPERIAGAVERPGKEPEFNSEMLGEYRRLAQSEHDALLTHYLTEYEMITRFQHTDGTPRDTEQIVSREQLIASRYAELHSAPAHG